MLEDIWRLATLKDEQQDKLARAFHQTFLDDLKRRQREGENIQEHPANKAWEHLDETFKEANRALADHLRIKLYAVGLTMQPSSQPAPSPLSEAQIELLSRMEHARWCAERWLDGWSYADQKNPDIKKHNLLLPWDQLPPEARKIDKAMMANICNILAQIGYGVVSWSHSGTSGSKSS
jgi:hypothetical protein